MSVDVIQAMYEHNAWANERAAASMRKTRDLPESAVKLFSHMVAAEELWYARLVEQEISDFNVFPEHDVDESARRLAECSRRFLTYIAGLERADLKASVSYKTTEGVPYSDTVEGILTHVALHEHYHRGQIAAAVREAGGTPAVTDHIVFLRSNEEGE